MILETPEEKSTYWLRGMGPAHNASPIRANIRSLSRVDSPERLEIVPEINIIPVKVTKKVIVEIPKPKR